MQKVDILIRTKLRVPFIRPEQVSRPRLQERIAQGLRGPLTLVNAPAGFGKTTLVASCIANCGMPAAWLSLDKDDNQAERFLKYLVSALQEINPSIGSKADQFLAAAQNSSPDTLLTSLINDLEAAAVEMVMVLEDYQFINSKEVHQAVTFLLEHCPKTLHLVIVTRSDPALPLIRWRARGQTLELRAADLRFNEHEAEQFLNEVMALELDDRTVAALAERTEGWIAGLQMAALSMRDRQDVIGFIEGFSGTNRYILDYLLEEVLDSQPPEIQRFLLYTSILERLSAPLCDAVLSDDAGVVGEKDDRSRLESLFAGSSSSFLEHLERANLFLVPLDDARTWYRYHQLFADLLRTQLKKSIGEHGVVRLHLQAAEWYEKNGSILDAIHHASVASDYERIERLIEQNFIDMLNKGEMSGVRYWMGKLSKDLVTRRPWLSLYEAFSRSWFGQLEEASLMLKEADKRIQSEVTAPDWQAMVGYHAYIQSRITAMQGDTRQAIQYCLTARENIPASNLGMQIEVGITLGYEYFLVGDLINAQQVLHEMLRLCNTVRAINNPVAASAILARARILQGRLQEAYDLFHSAEQLIRYAGGQHLGATALVEVGAAALLYEWNRLEAAVTRLKKGLDCLPWWGKADDLCLAYTTQSRIHLALGNQGEAESAAEKADQLAHTCSLFSEARSAVETTRVKLWLVQGNWLEIDRWATGVENRLASSSPDRFEEELIQITLARVFIVQNQPDKAIRLLSRLEEFARSDGRHGRLIEILILQALAIQAAGDTIQAKKVIAESLCLAEPGGFVRVFLDEGRPVQLLLTQWLSHERTHGSRSTASPLRQFACQILSQFDTSTTEALLEQENVRLAGYLQPSHGQAVIEPLSPRELEVLRLMALGRTNHQISRQLIVARGTVKAHTASIYRKLDVSNRTEAVARARQLGLLS
jgi:LuxR family transcriptional regulator, maltose regulon positive regulatory protein